MKNSSRCSPNFRRDKNVRKSVEFQVFICVMHVNNSNIHSLFLDRMQLKKHKYKTIMFIKYLSPAAIEVANYEDIIGQT